MSKRGTVWLAVSGIVENERGEWLVVKKQYGGLKGKWSFPTGFVEENETVDEAVVREVKEETNIAATVRQIIGVRTGVLANDVSDNMILFYLTTVEEHVVHQERELFEARFMTRQQLANDDDSSILVKHYAKMEQLPSLQQRQSLNPGQQFGYKTYKLYE